MTKVLIVGISKVVGGIETLFFNLFGSRNDRVIVDFVTFDETCAFETELEKNGHKIYHLPSRRKKKFLFDGIVKAFLRNNSDYDYIWINTSSNSMYQFQFYGKKLTRAKIITHSHGTKAYQGKMTVWSFLNSIFNITNRGIIRKYTDIFVGCSRAAGVALFGKNIEKKLILLNNGIDTDKYMYNVHNRVSIRKQLGIESDVTVLGMIGRLSSQKNPLRGVQIFKSLAQKKEKCILLIIGDGELRGEISEYIKKNELNNIVFLLGLKNNIAELLSALDILIMPSLFEGLPIVAVESQCAGVTCFLSDEITDEVKITDLVYRLPLTSSNEEWADKIIELYKDVYNREKYACILKENGYSIEETKRRALSIVCG